MPRVRKLILKTGFAPGDGVMLTAAVRDLHRTYPGEFLTDVQSPYPALWKFNPHRTPLRPADADVEIIDCDYPLIQQANARRCHFLHGFIEFLNERLQRQIRLTDLHGDIHLSDEERQRSSQVTELLGQSLPYWIVAGGGKFDLTIKWWEHARWQSVVDHFRDRLLFVQVGSSRHFHPRLQNALDLRGWTDLRQLIHLVHHADGVLCPVTCLMHLAAAVPRAAGSPQQRPCVVVAGGREPAEWEAYPGHHFLHTIGQLECCRDGGCWRRRTVPLGDGNENDKPEHLCIDPVGQLPRCMDQITPAQVIDAIEACLETGAARPLTPEQRAPAQQLRGITTGAALDETTVTRSTARMALQRYKTRIPGPQGTFEGAGIVTAAFGLEYFVSAWVCIRMLRQLGCKLPIELWHQDDADWSATLERLVRSMDVIPVNTHAVLQQFPATVDHRFAIKPYCLVHSRFQEVLWLDADQVPVKNPAFLFETPPYRETGAVFWPDFGRYGKEHALWGFTGVAYRDEPEVQAGELLIDKARCWDPLRLSLWFNEHHRFFYRHMMGDKDTYRFAWHALERRFAMPSFPIRALTGTMCQHDFDGHRLFQHRNMRKWKLNEPNAPVAGFWFESECLGFIEELRRALTPEDLQRLQPKYRNG